MEKLLKDFFHHFYHRCGWHIINVLDRLRATESANIQCCR